MSATILFDLDGALIDSEPGIVASCAATLRALGHSADSLDIARYIGPPLEEMITSLLRARGDDRVELGVAAYRRHYGETGLLGSQAYPGIAEALQNLRGAGARLFVATSKREVFARRILENLDLARWFDDIYGSVPGGALDEKPALLAHILAVNAINPARALMIGDRRYDIIGAHANNMRGLGVLWGFGAREELEAAGADAIVAHPDDLAAAALALLDMAAGKKSR